MSARQAFSFPGLIEFFGSVIYDKWKWCDVTATSNGDGRADVWTMDLFRPRTIKSSRKIDLYKQNGRGADETMGGMETQRVRNNVRIQMKQEFIYSYDTKAASLEIGPFRGTKECKNQRWPFASLNITETVRAKWNEIRAVDAAYLFTDYSHVSRWREGKIKGKVKVEVSFSFSFFLVLSTLARLYMQNIYIYNRTIGNHIFSCFARLRSNKFDIPCVAALRVASCDYWQSDY